MPVTHQNPYPGKVIMSFRRCWTTVLVAFPMLNRLLCDNTWNHSRRGFLFFVILHPLSCSIVILTCSLLTALTQKTEIINEFRLGSEETRNSQEWLSSEKLTQLHSAPVRLCRLATAGFSDYHQYFFPKTNLYSPLRWVEKETLVQNTAA